MKAALKALMLAENGVLVAALAALAILPIVEAALRSVFHVGVPGAGSLAQHCALVAGMFGGVVAARERRLLTLSTLQASLTGRPALIVRYLSAAVAAAVAVLLCVASIQFVVAERPGGNVIIPGIPVWIGEAALPVGFGLIALRLAWHAGSTWPQRAAVVSLCGAVVYGVLRGGTLSDPLALSALGAIAVAAACGSPVFITLGGAALFLFWREGLPIASVALDHYRMVVNPSLPMIPLFALAGYFLAEGGAPARLVRVCNALLGGMRGGAALVTVAVCAFFTSFSGASGVTIIAVGGMLMPLLAAAGHSQKNGLGLLAAAGSLGGLLPPGLPLVLYAIVAKIPIEEMFLAGVVPGLLLMTLVTAWAMRSAAPLESTARRIDWTEARAALWEAKWELAVPVIALAGLFGGVATPVEAAAATALYAFVIEVFVYRDLDLVRDVPRVMAECGLLIGGVLLILGVALGLSNYVVDARIPDSMVDWARSTIHSRWAFILALNLFLLVAGCFLDIFSATVVLVPLLLPLAAAFGVEPLHLGIIFLANMELGYLTPPVGMNLFFTAYRFNRPLPEVFRAALPAAAVLALGVALVSAIPVLATGLPSLVK